MAHKNSRVVGLLIVCLWLGKICLAEGGQQTLAIVATEDANAIAFGDLLTAELSASGDVALVERDRIRAALTELELNAGGLVATERQIQLGKILAADVVLFVEKPKGNRLSTLHVSAVETRTGLQLTSAFIRADGVDELATVASKTVRTVLEGSRLPDDERTYVAVAGVLNEEPGQTLTPVTQALAGCLVHDLQRTPRVFVLERRRLQELTAERDLTGIELALKSSALLVEVGLRRVERGDGYRMTVRLTSSNGQAVKQDELETETVDIEAVRHALHARVVKLLGGTVTAAKPGDRQAEARRFATLAYWLHSNGRYEQATDAAESAFALDATPGHCQLAHRGHSQLIRLALQAVHRSRPRNINERRNAYRDGLHRALIEARRCHELDIFWLEHPVPPPRSAPPIPTIVQYALGVSGDPFQPHIDRLQPWSPNGEPVTSGLETKQMQELRQEYDALRWQKYRLLTERARGNPNKLADLANFELLHASYFATDGADYVRRVLKIQENIDHLVELLNAQGGGGSVHFDGRVVRQVDMIRRQNAKNLAVQLRLVYPKNLSATKHHPQWSADELVPLWTTLMRHTEPKIAVLGCSALHAVESHRDAAVRRGLEVLPEVDECGVEFCAKAREHLGRSDELEAVLESVVARAEKANAPAELTHRKPLILALFAAIGPDSINWLPRIEKLLTGPIPPRSPLAHNAIWLRELLKTQTRKMKPLPATPSGLTPNGAWADYKIRIVEPKKLQSVKSKLPSDGALLAVYPIVNSKDDVETNKLWGFYRDSETKVVVGRVSLADGKVDPIASLPWFRRGQAFARPITAACGADALYVMTGRPGLARIDLATNQVREWGVEDGFVGEMGSLAVHRSKLYIGMRGGLCEFDPAKNAFRLLASSSAVQRRSKLDSGISYGVGRVVADRHADCVWLSVNAGNRSGLNGIWQYDVANETFKKHLDTSKPASYPTSNFSWFNDQLFFLSTHGWQTLDTRTGVADLLGGYARYRLTYPRSVDFLRVGAHIIQANGQLYTPDGKVHDGDLPAPWPTIMPIRNGFIAFNSQQILVFTRQEPAPEK